MLQDEQDVDDISDDEIQDIVSGSIALQNVKMNLRNGKSLDRNYREGTIMREFQVCFSVWN